MPNSFSDPAFIQAFQSASQPKSITIQGSPPFWSPFASPPDWRDRWIYFLLVDRFDNPQSPPAHGAYDAPEERMQGGNLAGVRARLPYLKRLGVGAIWLSPVLKNWPTVDKFWGGYSTQDFLTVEPRFTSNPAAAAANPAVGDHEFRALVDEAHALGMHVILDIVLNHAGDVFNYEGQQDSLPWRVWPPYDVYWRDQTGNAVGAWTDIATVAQHTVLHPDAAVWPKEFQKNEFFRRQGAGDPQGDFDRMKELNTGWSPDGGKKFPVRDALIRVYQYLIAKFDLDGYRIDTLKYVEREFARTFGNAMREYALSIGKRNFFTFGEVWEDDQEDRIAEFVGRFTDDHDAHEIVGVDAAIDFPIRKRVVNLVQNRLAPSDLAAHYKHRREALKKLVSSHGEASRFFVTFLDNHDLTQRLYYTDPQNPTKWDAQFTMALTCLFCLQGIPCLYYGNEQGLSGHNPENDQRREYARECLWGKPGAFDEQHVLYQLVKKLSDLREERPAIRYGRQYFREVSGNGQDFGMSSTVPGILAFSRVLNDAEVLVVANTDTANGWSGYVLADPNLNSATAVPVNVFSNVGSTAVPAIHTSNAGTRAVKVTLAPMEALVVTFG